MYAHQQEHPWSLFVSAVSLLAFFFHKTVTNPTVYPAFRLYPVSAFPETGRDYKEPNFEDADDEEYNAEAPDLGRDALMELLAAAAMFADDDDDDEL